jgi:hypothetical protein
VRRKSTHNFEEEVDEHEDDDMSDCNTSDNNSAT